MKRSPLVLVIDDDPAIVDAVRMLLELDDFATEGYSGSDIMGTIEELQPDLVLLDVWLSGTDGRAVCQAVKHHATLQATPIILISAGKDLSESAKNAGADDFIEKPFDMDALLQKVHQLLPT